MALKEFKIVVWCGSASNQKALVNKIAAAYKISGIVIDTGLRKRRKRNWIQLPGKILDRIRFRKVYAAWNSLLKQYDSEFPNWPDIPTLRVEGINDHKAKSFTDEIRPDLILVSGTALIKEPLISIPTSIGIINLHTGLSPYVKGGPNCTNWCIANNTLHLVGNTIMWLNAGIDTGNIITTEQVDIRNCRNLNEAHRLVMEKAHDLYLRAVNYLYTNNAPLNSIPQDSIANGNLYLTKMWTAKEKAALIRNWKKRENVTLIENPQTVSLKSERGS
jgi:folate-dependent phosphoribosylglycinamide formyltransferase PurN